MSTCYCIATGFLGSNIRVTAGYTDICDNARGACASIRIVNPSKITREQFIESGIYRFSEYQKQILRNFALKIPPKINRLSMVLLFVMLLLYVVVLGTTMFDSFGTLFSF